MRRQCFGVWIRQGYVGNRGRQKLHVQQPLACVNPHASSSSPSQVPPEEEVKFGAARASLSDFTFKELGGDVRAVFDQFIQ